MRKDEVLGKGCGTPSMAAGSRYREMACKLGKSLNGSSPEETQGTGTKALVVYFSATGNTKAVAETLAELQGADIQERWSGWSREMPGSIVRAQKAAQVEERRSP